MKTELIKGFNNTLFTSPKDIFYLTDCPFDGFWLAVLSGQPTIITSKMMFAQCGGFFKPRGFEIVESSKFSTTLGELCLAKNITAVEISENLALADFNAIKEILYAKGIKLESVKDKLMPHRYVKTAEEISRIKEACRITSEVAGEIRAELKAGLTELDIHYKILEKFACRHVSESFAPIVASGANSADPHHVSGPRIIERNDIVLIDMGCKYKGYSSDLTRTFFLDKINAKYQHVFDIVQSAQKAALAALKAGVSANIPDTAARGIIENAGYGANFIHSTGHGVGLDVHESPRLIQKATEVLKAGCIVAVEPGIYLAGEFGVRIEDTVLITENGYEILTES